MGKRIGIGKMLFALSLLLILILHANICANGAFRGIDLCIRTVIPSLFPFFVICTWINPMLLQFHIPGIRFVCKWLDIPYGCEGLLLLGLTGGYPVGAQAIAQYHKMGYLDKRSARRILGFCNNAGPAFIFGVTASLFPSAMAPLSLWLIHIISAVITGICLPGVNHPQAQISYISHTVSLTHAVRAAASACLSVCCWIILFQTFMSVLQEYLHHCQWFDWIYGLAELCAGCYKLKEISHLPLRFILTSSYLGFGGFCVMLQTASVTGDLMSAIYPTGKILQTLLSIALSCPVTILLFPQYITHASHYCIVSAAAITAVISGAVLLKKRYSNSKENAV